MAKQVPIVRADLSFNSKLRMVRREVRKFRLLRVFLDRSVSVNENRLRLFANRIPRADYYLPLEDLPEAAASFEAAVVASISR